MNFASVRLVAVASTALCAVTAFTLISPPAPPKRAAAPPNRQAALMANEAAVDALLKQLTLEEKIKMVHANSAFAAGGIARLNILHAGRFSELLKPHKRRV